MKTDKILKLIQQKKAMRSGGALPLPKAQEGLQYVPNGTYGNYYDPATQQYIRQIYLPELEISASKSLPFQNGKFAPFLAAKGMVENDVLSDPIAMAAALTAGGVGLGATALSQIPRVFARNLASEATAGLSDITRGGLKNFDDIGDDLFDEDIFSKEIEEAVKQIERNKLRSRLQDLSGRSKVPDQYMIDARGLASKEPTVGSQDFYTQDEITANANQWKEYWDARDKFDQLSPEHPGSMIMSALTGDKSRMNSFENLFPDAKLPNWREKFYQPEQLKELRESLPYEDQFRFNDPLAPKGGLKFFQQRISSSKEVPSKVNDYLSRLNDTWHLNNPRDYVSEMRGSAGLSLDDVKNLSDDEVKNIANSIHSKILKQNEDRMMDDIFRTPSAIPSLRGFTAGQMNKLGGLAKAQTGGDTVSEIWKKVTGSDWSQAKKLGLTDGSYEQNMKLRNKLVSSPEYRALVSPRPQAERPRMSVPSRVSAPANSYRVQMPNMTAASDATRVAPSGRKAEYEYYSQQPFGITDPNSVMPRELQVARMAAMNNQDQIRQTQTGPRKAIQDAYRSATSTNNDLANMVTGVLGYPVQAGLNIANTVMGDTPIRSDADVAALGLDALSLIPAVKGASALSKRALTSPVPTPRVQRFMASGPGVEGFEVIRRGAPKGPLSSVTVVDKNISGPGRYLTAKRNPKTGEYRFEWDMESIPSVPRRGHGINLLKEQFPRGTRFQETSTMSLDSYRNLLGMKRNPRYAFETTQPTFLNTQAANAKFLDDIADPYITDWSQYESFSPAKQMRLDAWDAAGSKMMFSTKKAAEEAAKRINERYLDKFGFTERATPIKGDGKKWNVSIPNYRVTQQYLTGGSLKVRIKKQH